MLYLQEMSLLNPRVSYHRPDQHLYFNTSCTLRLGSPWFFPPLKLQISDPDPDTIIFL